MTLEKRTVGRKLHILTEEKEPLISIHSEMKMDSLKGLNLLVKKLKNSIKIDQTKYFSEVSTLNQNLHLMKTKRIN